MAIVAIWSPAFGPRWEGKKKTWSVSVPHAWNTFQFELKICVASCLGRILTNLDPTCLLFGLFLNLVKHRLLYKVGLQFAPVWEWIHYQKYLVATATGGQLVSAEQSLCLPSTPPSDSSPALHHVKDLAPCSPSSSQWEDQHCPSTG